MAILRIAGSTWAGPQRDLVLPDALFTLGREKDNGLVLDSNEISRHHARLARTAEGWAVEDLGSSNGTYVNGVRVARHLLQEGDVIGLGSLRLTFFRGLPPPAPAVTLPSITPPPLPPPAAPPQAPGRRPAGKGGGAAWIGVLVVGLVLLAGLVAGAVLFLPRLTRKAEPAPAAPIAAEPDRAAIAWDGPERDPQRERAVPGALSAPLPPDPAEGFSSAGTLRVPASGGTFALDTFVPALKGSRLEIPAGAYPAGATLRLSQRSEARFSIDPRFTQASPVLRVEGPSAPAARPLRLHLTAPCGSDEFLLPCYAELGSGQLHPMTRLGQKGTTVTALVRHFSDVVVVKARIKDLENGGRSVETGFLPSVHGWPFTNDGSIANSLAGHPRGNCEGMVLGASWAYRIAKAHPLMKLADNLNRNFRTPQRPEDDARGQYFCGRLQAAHAPSGEAFEAYGQERLEAKSREHWLGIRAGLLLTGQPQIVSIYEIDGAGNQQAAHAILAYGYSTDGRIRVYDPNACGDDARVLEYDLKAEAFRPFESGRTQNDQKRFFNKVIFTCDEDWVSWKDIHQAAIDFFLAGSIPPNALPFLTFEVCEEAPKGGYGMPNTVNMEPRGPLRIVKVGAKRIAVRVKSDRANVELRHRELVLDAATGPTWVTDWTGSGGEPAWIDVKPAAQVLGAYFEAKLAGEERWAWSGFQWFSVAQELPKAQPKPPARHYSRRSY